MANMENSLDRFSLLVGSEKLEILKNKKVLVVGLGGVGGYVVEGLVRSGISNLTLVDGDIVDFTNMNRQIIAFSDTVGLEKAIVMKKHCLSIFSSLAIDSKVLFLDKDNLDDVFDKEYDYVIDACDRLSTKKLLIDYCIRNQIPLISSMGTARKMDPSCLMICDIKKTSYDPLAREIRKYMKEHYPHDKLAVLSSVEVPRKVDSEELASCIFVPASAGLLIARYVILEFLNQ